MINGKAAIEDNYVVKLSWYTKYTGYERNYNFNWRYRPWIFTNIHIFNNYLNGNSILLQYPFVNVDR